MHRPLGKWKKHITDELRLPDNNTQLSSQRSPLTYISNGTFINFQLTVIHLIFMFFKIS